MTLKCECISGPAAVRIVKALEEYYLHKFKHVNDLKILQSELGETNPFIKNEERELELIKSIWDDIHRIDICE